LELAPVNDCRRQKASGPEQLAAEVLGMQLLVFPGPDQGLADKVASILTDVQRGNPASHGLLAVSHCHNLLALKSQQQEAMAFQLGPVSVFGTPPLE
jgi:hypothetical protein